MSVQYGPLWQMQQQIESKRLVLVSIDTEEKKLAARRAEALEELAEYEQAVNILKKAQQ